MKKIKVLHIGIKNFPFNSSFEDEKLSGIRGGGMNKYCDILIHALPINIETFVITQKLKSQKRNEIYDRIHIKRIKSFGGRTFRQILTNLLSFFYAIIIIRKNEIDIVHGHMQPGILIAYFLGKILNIKVVGTPYSFTTNKTHFNLSGMAKFIESYYYKRIDKLIFETHENELKAYELRGLKYSNSVVINTGVYLPEKKEVSHYNDKINVLYIGRIVEIKALDKLVLSLLHMNDSVKESINIDIVGEGELLNSLRLLVKKQKLENYITLHGFVYDTFPFLKTADIFILPSDMEGLSISLLEAMSYGKACIVNDFGVPFSSQEVIVMKNNNPVTIAEAISFLVEHRDIIQTLGNNARLKLEKDFSITAFAEKYAKVYLELI